MVLQESTRLNSPFNTPIAQRFISTLDRPSPPFSSPIHCTRTQYKLQSSPAPSHHSPFLDRPAVSHNCETAERISPRASLNDLPPELLQEIHLLSTNHNFPVVSRHVFHSLHRPTPTFAARWLLKLYESYGYRNILARAFKHRVVDLAVLKEMVRLWDERRGAVLPRSRPPDDYPITPSKPRPLRPALRLSEVPRRAVRLSTHGVSPLLIYIFDHFEASVNSFNGFPLQRAALDKNHELAEWLLRRGADPGLRDSLAVEAAIDRQDLRMIKLLVEPFDEPSSGGKRRRVADRVHIGPNLVEKALSKGTEEIVEYLVHDKGGMPPLGYIMGLSR